MKNILYLIVPVVLLSCTSKQSAKLLPIKGQIGWENFKIDSIVSNTKRNHNIEDANELLDQFKGSKILYAYVKYNGRSINPSIRIESRENHYSSDSEFFKSAEVEIRDLKKYFDDFKFIENPKIINFKGVNALYCVTTYSLKGNDTLWHPRSKNYFIPAGKIIYQIHFNDEMSIDYSKDFNQFIKQIEFQK